MRRVDGAIHEVFCSLCYSPEWRVWKQAPVNSRPSLALLGIRMSFERITVVGNIGSAELLTSKAGNPYLRLSVAAGKSTGDGKGVTWYSVLLFGSMVSDSQRLQNLYTKGRLVLVEGRPQVEAFIKRDGSAGLDNTIIAISMPELLDARPHA